MQILVARTEREQMAVLVAVSLMFSLTIVDGTIINIAMYEIGRTLGAGFASLQWITTTYLIAFASLLLLSGVVADRIGAKPVFIAGVVVFVSASMLCGFSPSIAWLTAGRTLQGIGAALAVPTSLTLIKQNMHEPRRQARAVSIWVGWSSLSLAGGLLLGGGLVERFGWPSIFFVNLPIGLLILALSHRFHPEETPDPVSTRLSNLLFGPVSIDHGGVIFSIVAVAGLTMASINLGNGRILDAAFLLPLAFSLIATWLFIRAERRSSNPLVPPGLIRHPDLWRSCAAGMIVSFSYYGLMFFFGILFQFCLHFRSAETGVAFLPMTAATVFGNMIGGYMAARWGARRTIMIGTSLGAVSCLAAAAVGISSGWSLTIDALCVLVSLGVSTAVPALTYLAISRSNLCQTSLASGLLNAARQLGAVLGIGIFGSIANLHQAGLDRAFPVVMVISAAAFVVGIAISLGHDDARPLSSRLMQPTEDLR